MHVYSFLLIFAVMLSLFIPSAKIYLYVSPPPPNQPQGPSVNNDTDHIRLSFRKGGKDEVCVCVCERERESDIVSILCDCLRLCSFVRTLISVCVVHMYAHTSCTQSASERSFVVHSIMEKCVLFHS